MNNNPTIKRPILLKLFNKKKNQVLFLVFSIFSIAVMVMIFLFSNQPATESAALSNGLSDIIADFIADVINDDPSQKVAIFTFMQTFIRKLAHFTLFALLGFSLGSAALNIKGKKVYKKLSISAIIGLAYCITDEVHQLFIPERSGEVRDVIIDFSGIMFGILIALAAYKIICSVSKKRKSKKL